MHKRSELSESDRDLLVEIGGWLKERAGQVDEEHQIRRIDVAADLRDVSIIRSVLRLPNSCLA